MAKSGFSSLEPVVVSGISCRLPESDNMQEFRDNLMNSVDMVTEDDRRWKPGIFGIPRRNGKLKTLSKFDASFFGIHPKQASYMDPQIRILLELSYEAIIDAGVNPETLRDSNTGVFIGAQASESQTIWNSSRGDHIGFVLTGSALSLLSNRISFCFDFKGPSLTLDTACSSGLYAMNAALQNIRNGNCDAAIVGGTCLCLRPDISEQFLKLGMLSPEGMCKTFDKDGNGYCRSDGIVAMFLQKEKDAKRIYCNLIHSKVNSDGYKKNGMTFPSGAVQKRLLEATYAEAGVNPLDVEYVEAHGTGTPVGDPQECYAISEVFCKDREGPLLIGSTKSNMGHAESASGVASFAKLVIAMEERVIPANLHYKEPSEYIPSLHEGKLEVVNQNKTWSGGFIGVNSFGFGGANAHVIVKANQKEKIQQEGSDKPRLFIYGSRTAEATELVLKMARKHSKDMDLHALWSESAHMSPDTHPYRGFTILNGGHDVIDIQKTNETERPVWFVFSGMGSQWTGMGRDMMKIDVFRNSIMKSDAILKQHGVKLYDTLMSEDESLMKSVVNSFVCITSIQVALVDMLTCMGIVPDGLVGHSVGELGCAYADGSLTAEETVLAAYWRGYCVQNAKLPPGGMAAVGLTWEEAVDQCPAGIVPACHNSEGSVTVSGPLEDIKRFVDELKQKKIFAKEVQSAGVAFHSYFMKNVAPALESALNKVITAKPRSDKWISSSFPESEWATDVAKLSSVDYHVHNLVSPVLFHEALGHVPSNAVVIEIAPHCLLQSILKGSLGAKCCIVGLMKRNNAENVDFCFTALGKCYQNGVKIDPLTLYPPVEFPVPRGTPMISPVVKLDHSHNWEVAKVNMGSNRGTTFELDLSKNSDYRFLLEHKIDGRPVLPAAAALVLTWRALANKEDRDWEKMPVMFESVRLYRATILVPDSIMKIEVKFLHGSDEFQVIERDDVVMSGTVRVPDSKAIGIYLDKDSPNAVTAEIPTDFEGRDLYKDFRLKGFEYGPAFQLLIGANSDGMKGVVKWTDNWITFLDAVLHLPILKAQNLLLPTGIVTVMIDPALHEKHLQNFEDDIQGTEVKLRYNTNSRVTGGVHIYDVGCTLAQRVEQKTATHESFQFVPYSSSLSLTEQDLALVKYSERCLSVSAAEFLKATNNGFTKSRHFSEKLLTSGQTHDASEDIIAFQENLPDAKQESSCLASLLAINKVDHNEKYDDSVTEILKTNKTGFEFDILLSNLLQAKFLVPALGIFTENVRMQNAKCVEISEEKATKTIQNLTSSNILLKPKYYVALVDSKGTDNDAESEPPGDTIPWDLEQKAPVIIANAQLVIANNVIRKHQNIKHCISSILDILAEEGFILIHEVTTNFQIAACLDNIYCDNVTDYQDLDDRTCSIYCNAPKWKNIFEEEGLEVIYEVSDNLLSSLFLLRRKVTNVTEKQTVIDVNDTDCGWVEDLKGRVEEVGNKAKGENLWLRADSAKSGILGLVTCLGRELENNKLRCIFNMDGASLDLDDNVMKMLVSRDLFMNVYKNGVWGSYQHLPLEPVQKQPSANVYVNVLKRGDLSSLSWIRMTADALQLPREVQVEQCDVTYASLNFRDVMLATGRLPPDAIPGDILGKMDCLLGMEFSGRDSKGNRVMGLTPTKGIATTVQTHKQLIWAVPDSWTLEQAATVPTVYTTVFYALVVRGQIKPGNTVLIHSGSGGVGQAAISVALHYGCKVFTTVGTPEKKQFLKERFPELDDSCFFSSRDTAFEFGIKEATSGKGVDIVLNSLAEDKLQASVRILAVHGKFLEIGKYDLAKNTPLGLSHFLKNITFHGILMDSLFNAESKELEAVNRCMDEGMKTGVVQPLRSTVFEKEAVEEAFRYMASGKHIGKVLIKVRNESEPVLIPAIPRYSCNPNKTYIITGGLGGFGLELADWLVNRGAKSLVLTSRSGVRTGYQRWKISTLQKQGVDVRVSTKRITDKKEVEELFADANRRPVGGVFHLAAVLNDALLDNQSQETFLKVLEPKVIGAINLDQVTRERCKDTLEWFVLFSSTTSGYGNTGQTNYGFANSCMERLIEERRRDGYPGLAIQWGPIGDVGLYMDAVGGNDVVLNGVLPQRLASCFKSLDIFLNQPEPIVTCYVTAELSNVSKLAGVNLVDTVCKIIGIKNIESLDENKPFADLGLDSLLAVEVKIKLENEYNIVLGPKEIRELNMKKLKALAEGETLQDDKDEEDVTLATLLNIDVDSFELTPTDIVKKLNAIEDGEPVFVIHDVFGTVVTMRELVSKLKAPVYGLQRTLDVPVDSLAAIASCYLTAIRQTCKGQPFHLVGYSFGAVVAQEMALELQDSQSTELKSLTFLDGSPGWVHTLVENGKKHSDNMEMQAISLMFGAMGVDINADINEITEESLEKTAKKLQNMKPDVPFEEAKAVARGTYNCVKLVINYRIAKKYYGDLTLIKAENSSRLPGLTADYGINEYCAGNIVVETVPGRHVSFLMDKSGDQVASIINNIVTTKTAIN